MCVCVCVCVMTESSGGGCLYTGISFNRIDKSFKQNAVSVSLLILFICFKIASINILSGFGGEFFFVYHQIRHHIIKVQSKNLA